MPSSFKFEKDVFSVERELFEKKSTYEDVWIARLPYCHCPTCSGNDNRNSSPPIGVRGLSTVLSEVEGVRGDTVSITRTRT
jgi:hypothetical protein